MKSIEFFGNEYETDDDHILIKKIGRASCRERV